MSDLDLTPSNATDKENTSAQVRVLKIRNSRFRGRSIDGETPHTPSQQTGGSTADFHATMASPGWESVDDPGPEGNHDVLQEISNSSIKRRRRQRIPSASIAALMRSSPVVSNSQGVNQVVLTETTDNHRTRRSLESGESRLDQSGSRTVSMGLQRPSRRRVQRRLASGSYADSSGYVEHLESQLVAVQTQLQSLTSPSTTRTQSSKLRALTSEARTLRQEVSDWEQKFDERITEQIEQHQMITSGLRAQIRALEKEREISRAKIQELEVDFEEKQRNMEATENANRGLERRLEVMAELLAASPEKVKLISDPTPGPKRKSRPSSMLLSQQGLPSIPQSPEGRLNSQIFARPPLRSPQLGRKLSSLTTGSDFTMQTASDTPTLFTPSLEDRSEYSDNTLVDSVDVASPGHRSSWMTRRSIDQPGLQRTGSKKMRKFHAGSIGPRPLILPATTIPATTNSGSTTVSAPPSAIPTPGPSTGLSSVKSPVLNYETPNMHGRRRSSTWTDRRAFSSSPHGLASHLHVPAESVVRDQTPSSHHNSVRSTASKVSNLSSVNGKNLFEELSRLRVNHMSKSDSNLASSPAPLDYRSSSLALHSPSGRPETPSTVSIPDTDLSDEPGPAFPSYLLSNASSIPRALATTRPSILLQSLLYSLINHLDNQTKTTQYVLRAAWRTTLLSRPVLEFRWWLIRILVGGLRRKSRSGVALCTGFLQRPALGTSSLGLGVMAHDENLSDAIEWEKLKALDVCNEDLRLARYRDGKGKLPSHEPPTAPPMEWLRLGVTLMFAVGVAIRDGPSSLFATHEPKDEGEEWANAEGEVSSPLNTMDVTRDRDLGWWMG